VNWCSIPMAALDAIKRHFGARILSCKNSRLVPGSPATDHVHTEILLGDPSSINATPQQYVQNNISAEATIGRSTKFRPNWLVWPVKRTTRTFRVHVVEPREYKPKEHGAIFKAALSSLVNTERSRLDPYAPGPVVGTFEPFDLITFPEAFLPIDELVSALVKVSYLESLGCVHVGLRPLVDGQHLFNVKELEDLVTSLSAIPKICSDDLTPFSEWLCMQPKDHVFNIGCVFTIDAFQSVRICLHPKLVRSPFETSPTHEKHMNEANLLTLVTLQPEDRTFLSITLQPIICSDTLGLDTDIPNSRPLEALNNNADCFDTAPPDHVDIVSVATCTPHPKEQSAGYRQWHPMFLDAFFRAASDPAFPRHHYSTFILSNFGVFPSGAPSGLSGAFIPIPLNNPEFPPFVTVSAWGRPKIPSGLSNSWAQATGDTPLGKEWSSLGYVASLDPFMIKGLAPACMLGFLIHRLPRDATRWRPMDGLTDFQLRTAMYDSETGDMVFRKEGSNA
jgi:hypothetical protein